MLFSRGQAQATVVRGLGQPCGDHAVDFISVSPRVFAVHPLPVQPDTEFVHFQGGLHAPGLRRLSCCRAAGPALRSRRREMMVRNALEVP